MENNQNQHEMNTKTLRDEKRMKSHGNQNITDKRGKSDDFGQKSAIHAKIFSKEVFMMENTIKLRLNSTSYYHNTLAQLEHEKVMNLVKNTSHT